MLLAFDIGNTNIHMGLWHNDHWAISWRARAVAQKMPDEYAVLVRNFLNSADVGYAAIDGVIIASVVPPLTASFVELVQRYMKCTPVVVDHTLDTGVTMDIDQPQQAGADRIANAAAVVALHGGGPAMVVDFGTSTNFDVISAENAYIGGALAPGLMVTHDALVGRAARLHKVELEPPPDAIGRNTIHALQSGLFWGYVDLIEGLVRRIKKSLDAPDAQVIATGGLATLVDQHSDVFTRVVPTLTLDGLRVIYERNDNRTQ